MIGAQKTNIIEDRCSGAAKKRWGENRRLKWGCGGLFVLAALGFACGGCHRRSRVEEGVRTRTFHFGNGNEPKSLDPALQTLAAEYNIQSALFEGLVNLANDGQTILPGVAESWEVSPDGLRYMFHLRVTAVWSDNAPLTAGDFVYMFRRVLNPAIGNENVGLVFGISGARAMQAGRPAELGVKALDAHTLEIQLDSPTPYLLGVLNGAPFVPVPRAVVEKFGTGEQRDNPWSLPGKLIGNGPYILKSWRPNQEVIVTRNPKYWDAGRVQMEELHFYPIEEKATEERAFRAQELHVTNSLPASKLPYYRKEKPELLRVAPHLAVSFIQFNTTRYPFNDSRLRRAFALSINKEVLFPKLLQGAEAPAHSLTRPGTGGYTPAPVADFDPVLARQLLASAGYPGGQGFPALDLKSWSGARVEMLETLQQAWRKELGIVPSVSRQEAKAFYTELAQGNFQIAYESYMYGVQAPETMLLINLSGNPANYGRWTNPEFDRAYRDASTAASAPARWEAVDRMEQEIFKNAPVVPITYPNSTFLVSPTVKGWKENACDAIDWREVSLVP